MEQRPAPPSPSRPPSPWLFTAPLLAALALLIAGVVTFGDGQWILFAAAASAMVVTLGLWRVHHAIELARADAQRNTDMLVRGLGERIERMGGKLDLIADQQLVSERAKQVAFRHKDLDTFRKAVREHVSREQFEPALSLCEEIERALGAGQDAATIRQEVAAKRQEWYQRRMSAASARLEELCKAERWAEAKLEAERVAAENADVEGLRNLPQEVGNRREAFKRQLRDSWHEAAYRGDVDASITVLRRLDPYLTPQEAEQMEETVRGIFREKMNQLRTEFGLAVKDERWADAIRVGETITREFPNARIAQEVRETMTGLRQRAGMPQPSTAPVSPPPPQRPASPLETAAREAASRG